MCKYKQVMAERGNWDVMSVTVFLHLF